MKNSVSFGRNIKQLSHQPTPNFCDKHFSAFTKMSKSINLMFMFTFFAFTENFKIKLTAAVLIV